MTKVWVVIAGWEGWGGDVLYVTSSEQLALVYRERCEKDPDLGYCDSWKIERWEVSTPEDFKP